LAFELRYPDMLRLYDAPIPIGKIAQVVYLIGQVNPVR
jgi:hypothetical protein